MKFIAIERDPIAFFGQYSFTEAPPLPNYFDVVLMRFRDKVVKTADELRNMHTTIWRVRAKRPNDRDEVVLLTIGLLSAPVSSDPRGLRAPTVLHITDPHFAIGSHRGKHVWELESSTSHRARRTLIEAITEALHGTSIGLVIITGISLL
jgi:hypothetical protein